MRKLLEISVVDQDISQHFLHICEDSSLESTPGNLLDKLLLVVKKQVGEDASHRECHTVFLADVEDLIRVDQTILGSDERYKNVDK